MLIRILVGEHMPVDDHIHAQISRRPDTLLYLLLQLTFAAIAAIAAILFCVQREPHCISTPVVPKALKCFLINILRKPREAMRAHTLQLNRPSVRIHKTVPADRERPVLGYRCRTDRY